MTKNPTWKIFLMYLFVLFLLVVSGDASAQMTLKCFNAQWNQANSVEWVNSLDELKTISYIDVGTDKEAQTKYKIAVIPTIIVFKDGEEAIRFQADLSFKMIATKEEVQEEIDNLLMSDF